MMFDKNDDTFVARAADVARRADFIRDLGFLRGTAFVVALIGGICALLEFFWQGRSGSAAVCAATAIVFFAVTLHADAQIKALKLFGRLSSGNSLHPTAGREIISLFRSMTEPEM
jgi:hypothetical protein